MKYPCLNDACCDKNLKLDESNLRYTLLGVTFFFNFIIFCRACNTGSVKKLSHNITFDVIDEIFGGK